MSDPILDPAPHPALDPILSPTPQALLLAPAAQDSTPATDQALLRRYRTGDLPAFEGLFARHARAVYDFFFYMTHSREQAVRLSQQTWLAVRKHRDELAAEARFVPWLFGHAVQIRRARSPAGVADMAAVDRKSLPDISPAALSAAADLPTPGSVDTAPVYRALAALADSYREVLVLHRLSGLSFADIAVALGATEAAVKARALQGYVLLAESRRDVHAETAAADSGSARPAAPLPLSRCPETEKLINLVMANPESVNREPLSTLVQHTHDCPLCEVTSDQLGTGYRALGLVADLARPETASLEQIARAVLPAVAHDFAPQGTGWAVALAVLALLLVAGTIAGLFLR